MKEKTCHVKQQAEQYRIERRFWGTRTAEDVVTALLKAHSR